ncbi:class I SAM-dependent methyltransferase [Nocardia africana]|uniref:Oxidoreductase (NAD-binding), involved in siderophore biosynthesis n=1 Tax=Nocardia africana TaxID=134964 RepID=A0A378WYE6_9NOCA|nr:class I SAM-dependent methyltransferase [Nocardia africana]MCC3312334.1 class I SAM-dependent methyltransferase [Nocardia africana]SUA46356.1 Oxidoreductase (NAD-binding), involved in siderophore biosynthesis [Nocardia africana]
MSEEYAAAAEFYDLMATPYVASVEPALAALLAEVDTIAGPVLDIGAGTGLSTMLVADAVPDARIIAVEPAPAMRAVLLSRLAARKDLRERITVLPSGFLDTELPAQCSAVVGLGVIGHFDAATRPRVWHALATALVPDGTAVVEIQRPGRVEVSPDRRYTTARAGLLRYEGWSRAEPVDAESLVWHMTYRTYRDDRLLQEVTARHRVWPAGADRLAGEARAAGLTLASADSATGLLRFTKHP